MKQAISVMLRMGERGGGVTRVALTRTEALARRGIRTRIATLGFDENLGRTFSNWCAQGRTHSDTNIVNFYRWFAELSLRKSIPCFENISTIQHLNAVVHRRVDSFPSLELKIVRYINENGVVFLEEISSAHGDPAVVMISLPQCQPLKFNSIQAAHAYWLGLLASELSPCAVIADAIQTAEAVGLVDSRDCYKILMMHSNHLLSPHVVGGQLAPKYKGVVSNLGRTDALILLTNAQLQDVKKQFFADNCFVIANPVVISDVQENRKDPDLVVVVTRLHVVKRIKNMINAFVKVLDKRPTARFQIWGAGEQEEELRAHIKKLGLEASVELKGFAVDVASVFGRASVSLGMSASEGFGVSFAESLGYGVPLVSLRTKYGPQEIVTDGIDGFLIDTEDELVERVVRLLSNPSLVKKMGDAGRISVKRFSYESIADRWIDLFMTLSKNPPRPYCADKSRIISNEMGSRIGWIYLPLDAEAVVRYKSARYAYVHDVCERTKFVGEYTKLSLGRYEVDEMSLDAEKGIYRFRLIRNGMSYRGVVGKAAVQFTLS